MSSPSAIGVITSGGDAAGMNSCIRAVIRAAHHYNLKCFAIRDGYNGMIRDDMIEADWEFAAHLLQEGGTAIGTARSAKFLTQEGRREACYNLIRRGIDGIVVIGGDGSLMGASILSKEWSDHIDQLIDQGKLKEEDVHGRRKLHFVGVVGSIDNDMYGTDNTIGADTALHRICECIDYIATTASSHKRAFVMEVMGRNCGYLGLMSAVVTGSDWVFIPECPPDEGWEEQMCKSIEIGRKNGKKCTVVIISEGARSRDGKPIKSDYVKSILEKRLELDTRVTVLGHIQRGGSPSAYDRYLGTVCGVNAVRTLVDESITEPLLIGMSGYQITTAPLMESVQHNIKNAELAKQNDITAILQKKNDLFRRTIQLFDTLKQVEIPPIPSEKKDKHTLAIVSVGAPAPGMNTFFRSVTRLGLAEGYRVITVKGGFTGMAEENYEEMEWMSVNGWAPLGGCILGTNRELPGDNIQRISEFVKKQNIDALVVIGGFEAYLGILEIDAAREKYPELANLSLVGVPATISNNVPATNVSIGVDKAMNNMVDSTDKIKQSSLGYCHRIFLVQVMGGFCGFQALMGALVSGAEGYFLHEDDIHLQYIMDYIQEFKYRFSSKEPKLSLFVLNEFASEFYTLPVIRAIFDRETDPSISTRISELGSIQQGGNPSPLDRIVAGQYALGAIDFVKETFEQGKPQSTVLGMKASEVYRTTLNDLKPMMVRKFRRPKHQWWLETRNVVDMMSRKERAHERQERLEKQKQSCE